MVEPESYTSKSLGLNVRRQRADTVLVERVANGAWFVTLELDLQYELADGRTLKINKQVRLRGSQEGKRPHPDPFGWKKKATKNRKGRQR